MKLHRQEEYALRFDHITHHVPDLTAAMTAYADLGFTVDVIGSSPTRGKRTAFSHNGRSYWEFIGVDDVQSFAQQAPARVQDLI